MRCSEPFAGRIFTFEFFMSGTKVTLSDAEIGLFCNAELILTKNHILQQTALLLQQVQHEMQRRAEQYWPGESLFEVPPKISRGENYLGLPYLVLDFPRCFGTEHIFAIRSFFWWGRFYSSTLHLSGQYAAQHGGKLLAEYQKLQQGNYYIHTGTDQWAHHFEAGNYQPLRGIMPDAYANWLQRQAPIKIAAKWPLEQWHFAANNLLDSWETLLRICLA